MLKTVSIISSCLLLTLSVLARGASHNNTLLIAHNGTTQYVIVVANSAIPAEQTAARQLQKYLKQVTGATFSIQALDKVPANAPQILVGPSKRVRSLLPNVNWESLGNGGIVIKTIGNNLILAGGRPRGTLYAVFQFLENTVECNWWTPTEKTIPHQNTLIISSQNVVYVPQFSFRETSTYPSRRGYKDPAFSTIMRKNGSRQPQSAKWGGHYTLIGRIHTMVRMLPPEKYFKEHPGWYTDPRNGDLPCTIESKMPTPHNCQLVLMNPQVIEALAKAALRRIKQNPDAGYISISQSDNRNYCKGPKATKLAKEQGSWAAPVIRAVNMVAARIHKKYPDFKVVTLAYQYSIKPPKTIWPADNVIVRLAPIRADFGHSIASQKWNKKYRSTILAWAHTNSQLFMWNYNTNFSYPMLPHPNWATLASNLRFYAEHNVTGIFEQSDAFTGGVGNFVQLREWVTCHLMWNPSLDQQKLINKFLNGYYGAAGPYLGKYLNLVEHAFLAQHRRLSTFNGDYSFFTLGLTNKAIRLFLQAAKAVQDHPELTARVRRARLSLDAVILHNWRPLHAAARKTGQAFLGPGDLQKAIATFRQTAHHFDVRLWRARESFDHGLTKMMSVVKSSGVPLPEFTEKYPKDDVIDIQGTSMNLGGDKTIRGIINDPTASNEKAAYIDGDTNAWAIKVRLPGVTGRWRIYAYARLDAKSGAKLTGYGINAGIRDRTNKKTTAKFPMSAVKAEGKQYQRFDLGVHDLNGGMYIWFAPLKKPNIKRIYIDRLILIRQNSDDR